MALWLIWELYKLPFEPETNAQRGLLALGVAVCGIVIAPWRGVFLTLLCVLMIAQGGWRRSRPHGAACAPAAISASTPCAIFRRSGCGC